MFSKFTRAYVAGSLGWALYKNGNEAIPYRECAVKSIPGAAEVRYLGMVYYAKNEIVLARRHLEKSLHLNKEFAGVDEVKKTLANILLQI